MLERHINFPVEVAALAAIRLLLVVIRCNVWHDPLTSTGSSKKSWQLSLDQKKSTLLHVRHSSELRAPRSLNASTHWRYKTTDAVYSEPRAGGGLCKIEQTSNS